MRSETGGAPAPVQLVVGHVARVLERRSLVLVAVDGGAGTGKSTFTRALAAQLEPVAPFASVHLDNFFRPSAERGSALATVDDHDWQRLRGQVIVPLRAGRDARYQLYDWPNDCLAQWRTIAPTGIVLIDGVSSLRRELAADYDLRIWMSCLRATRVARLGRRGDTPTEEVEHWMPSEDAYIRDHRPQARADLVIDASAEDVLLVERWRAPR